MTCVSVCQLAVIVVSGHLALSAEDGQRQFPATSLACSEDGRWLASVGESELCLHDSQTLQIQQRYRLPVPQAFDVAFVPGTDRLIVGGGTPGETGAVLLLDINDQPASAKSSAALAAPRLRLIAQRSFGDDVIYAVAVHRNRVIAAGHDRGLYRLPITDLAVVPGMEVASGKEAALTLNAAAHSKPVTDVVSAPDGELLVTAGADNTIRVWSPEGDRQIRAFNNHAKAVRQLALRPLHDGLPLLASAADDRTVRFWQPTIGRMVRFKRLASPATSVTWVGDGRCVAIGCRDGRVCFVDPQSLQLVYHPAQGEGWVSCLAAVPGTQDVIVGTTAGRLSRVAMPTALGD